MTDPTRPAGIDSTSAGSSPRRISEPHTTPGNALPRSGEAATEDSSPRIAIHAEIAPRIAFASHQCDVAVLADLAILNPGECDLEDLTLRLSADPEVLGNRLWTIDRIAAQSEFRPQDRRVTLAGGMLDALTEQMRAVIRLELRQGEDLLAESNHPIIALARNEWGGASFMPELLAAFVTPNDPAVSRLLKEAANILDEAGKRNSLEGYQEKSRSRSWEIVAGIWAAVSRRGLTYAEPPASFERQGQKIRLPSMIEAQGLATCLDTALLFAAAIEQAGLYPVLVFTEGHALAGAWLQPQNLPTLTVEDPMEIRKAIAQDELVLFETTMATGGHALPFSRAIAEGKRQVSESNEAAFVYAIDIRQARGRGIQPLSSIAAPETGGPQQAPDPSRAAPPLDLPPDLPPFDIEQPDEEAPQTPAERLERWKRSLLDLSKRNRLLNLRPSTTAIPIFCPDPAALEDKIADGKRIKLITPPERTNTAGERDTKLYHLRTGEDFAEKFATEALERYEIVANVEQKALDKGIIDLYRKAKADFAEGGSNTLFLALGMLRWSASNDSGRGYRAPLILLPVTLQRRSAASKPSLTSHDDDPIFNLTLLQMLRQDFDIEIPGVADRLPTDEHGVDVRGVWDLVRARVREVPGFEVVEEVVLSTFSFAKYLMWKDLAERTETLKESPFVRHLIDTPRDAYATGAAFLEPRVIDHKINPAEIMAPLNADSAQMVAVHASGKAGDFVLEGPPGTGKSETIGNIIAHNLGLGHRVLFVSEKMAALEVVYRRLEACGLGAFCLELHSAKANKRQVIEQLGLAWGRRQTHSAKQWQQKAEDLSRIRDDLNGLVSALHKPGPGGLSPRDAIGRTLRYSDLHWLRLDWERDPEGRGHAPTPETLGALENLSKRLGQQFSQIDLEDVTAFQGIDRTEWSYAWVAEISQAARELDTAIETLVRDRDRFTERLALPDAGNTAEESAALAELAALIPDCREQNLRFALEANGCETLDSLEQLLELQRDYRGTKASLATDYVDARIADAPLQTWLAQRAAAEARLPPLQYFARRKLRKAMRVGLDCDAARTSSPEQDIKTLIGLAKLQAEMDALTSRLPGNSPWYGLDSDSQSCANIVDVGRRLRETVTKLANYGRDLVGLREQLARSLGEGREQLDARMPIAAAARALVESQHAFTACLQDYRTTCAFRDEATETADDLDTLASQVKAVNGRNRRLNAWCQWIAVSREARQAGLGTLVTALEAGTVKHDHTVACFRTAYALWLAPILIDARSPLKRFSAIRHEDLIKTFRRLDRDFAQSSADYIHARLSSAVPAREASNADNPGYGVLSRQLQRQRGHMPVRQLISEMGGVLTTLTPCLMMSPLSVAQFLPAEIQAFDLVVFDEASQITVPDAIGAIARGKRCIVVGDPKQMPPTRFFARGAGDDENEDARDLESVLDEAIAARVPHHRLTGHYRSRHESLICFSNHFYYQGTLVTYPAADTHDRAVSLRRVDGVYAQGKARTNEIEAKAVVAEVVRRQRDPRQNHLSLGVVTLNAEQQRLIEDLLDQQRRADPDLERFYDASRTEPVFVKNLETVQGDQRDVILLSVGYGPTEPGARTISMNFGPLNRQGGERRLNVAITRATTEVVLFASFDASMIDLTRTSAEAVHHLKHYIDYAARGPVALGEAIRAVGINDYDSDFELAVAERLRSRGWTVRTQIGVSKFRIDLGVVHPDAPGRFLAGIECDGATYHSSPCARDRDRVRHIVLEGLGWRLLRLWSTDFFVDPETSISKLDGLLHKQLEADRAVAEESSDDPCEPQIEAEHDDRAGTEDAVDASKERNGLVDGTDANSAQDTLPPPSDDIPTGPYDQLGAIQRVARAPTQTGLDLDQNNNLSTLPKPDPQRFHENTYRPQLRQMAAEIIDDEGPITFQRLSRLLARAHGFKRTGKQISSTVWSACARLRPHAKTPDGREVFWPENEEPCTEVHFRGLEIQAKTRDWHEVPHPEKRWLVRQVISRRSDDPARAVAESIGIRRVTSRFRDEIDALRQLLEHADPCALQDSSRAPGQP